MLRAGGTANVLSLTLLTARDLDGRIPLYIWRLVFFGLPDAHPTMMMNKFDVGIKFRSFKQGNHTHSYLYVCKFSNSKFSIPNSWFPILEFSPASSNIQKGGGGGGGFANTFSLARLLDLQVRDFLVNTGRDDGENRGADVESLLAQVQVVLHLIIRQIAKLTVGGTMDRTAMQM